MIKVYTIGHSTKPAQDIAAALAEAGVETLIDCRSIPFSKWNPQFNRTEFYKILSGYAVKYEWRGNNLGGLDRNVNHEASLQEMFERAANGEKLALMCSEGPYKKCHRGTILAPALIAKGATIEHILPGKKNELEGPGAEEEKPEEPETPEQASLL